MLINGTSTANVLTGTLDDDQIFAMGGSDNIYASKGTDTIDGGLGTDGVTVVLSRSDLFDPFTGPVSLNLTTSLLTDSSGQLNSSLTSIERVVLQLGDIAQDVTIDTTGFVSANALAVRAALGSGNNSYVGGNSADSVFLGLGYNVVDTGGGNDEVRAYFDSDDGIATVEYSDGAVLVRVGGVLTQEIRNSEFVYLQEFSQSVADGKTATIDASGFDPSSGVRLALIDHNGDDIMIGSAGADFISNTSGFTVGSDIFTGNGGADIFDYTVAIDAMNDDVITDFDSDDTIDFNFNNGIIAGQELCYLWIGSASFSGTAGEYRYYAADGQTFIEADVDGDTVADHLLTLANGQFALGETYAGSNILQMIGQSGTDEADFLVGTLGDDTIFGQGGNDTVAATQGVDRVDGGDGTDQLRFVLSNLDRFDSATGPETYTIQGNWIGNNAGTIDTTFSWIESLYLNTQGTGDFGDTIDASAATTRLILRLGAGDDTVLGGSGNDDLSLGLGINSADGGDGYDAVFAQFDNSTGSTAYVTSDGTNVFTIVDGVTVASVVNAEEIHINGFYASGEITTIDASGYAEVPGAVLVLRDSNGSDVIIGSHGADYLSNVSGNTLGSDSFTGNGGADIFDWTFASDNINGDVITDLDGDDILDFRFNNGDVAGASLLLCNQFIGSAAFGGVAGQYRYAASGGQTLIEVDTDGDAVADQTMSISNGQFALGETYAGSNILQIIGTSGTDDADFLVGANDSNDTIYAQGGNDTIAATGGMDFNYGGDGFDQLRFVMSNADRFWPAWGSRTFTVTDQWVGASDGSVNTYYFDMESLYLNTIGTGDFGDTIDGSGAGAALIVRAGNGDDSITGGAFDDNITTGLGINSVDSGEGYDIVYAQFDNDLGSTVYVTMAGGAVVTTIDGVQTNAVVNAEIVGAQGLDFDAGSVIDASGLTGFAGTFIFYDTNGTNIDIGSGGNDLFANVVGAEAGNDSYTGNGGADVYDYTFAVGSMDGDHITDFDSDDVIDLQDNNAAQNGGGVLAVPFIGTANFSGVAGQYRYFAYDNQTFVQVDSDGDTIADETLTIGNGQFALAETAPGSNVLHMVGASGTGAVDTLTGTLGDDSIYAQGGNDIINGSQGTDYVDGGLGGGDRLVMNTGDSSLFTAATGSRTYTIGASTITDSSGTLNTSFSAVERIAFSNVGNGDYDDVIDASAYVSGHSAGLDIRLGNGDNIVTGSSTNDRVFTGYGSNIVDGGEGYDYSQVLVESTSDVTVTITNAGGTLVTDANGAVNQLTDFEEVWVFGAGPGAVTLDASGYTGIDGLSLILVGHDGSDIMIGSAGNDFFANITGQVSGNDVYTGNGGFDIYDYTFAADSMNGDTITDFDIDDVIDFRFNTLQPGESPVLANHFIGADAFSGAAGEYRYQIDGTTTVVQVDSDGDTIVDQVLTISNGGFELAETEAGSNVLTLAAVINPVVGVVADGYVAGATLFVDVNGNGVRDDGEAWTVTDANGNYSLNVNQAGTIVAVGGTNADTGLANEMTLLAPYDSTVVNPLTTLVAAIMEQSGLDAAAAQDAVKDALGLDSSLDLLTTDLLSVGGDSALEAQKAAATIANLLTTAETVTAAPADAEASTLNVLAGLVAGGGSVDLTDSGTIETILESALPSATGLDVVADQLAAEGEAIAEADSLEDISAAQATAQLSGDDLANVITGNDLANALFGNGGSDWLFGLGGDDRLTGGDGVDYLTGGAGNDIFVAEIGATRVASKSGPISFDVITDFSAGDRIDVSSIDANALAAGDQDFHWMSTNANKSAGDLSIKVYDSVKGAEKALGIDIDGTSGPSPYSGSVTVLFGNVDGGSPDFAIALLNTNGLDPSGLIF
jgi:hypothetical protein